MSDKKKIRIDTLIKYIQRRRQVAFNAYERDGELASKYPYDNGRRVKGRDFQYTQEGKINAYDEIRAFLEKRLLNP